MDLTSFLFSEILTNFRLYQEENLLWWSWILERTLHTWLLFFFSLLDYPDSFTLLILVPQSTQTQGDMYYSSHFPMLKYKFYNSMLSLPSLKYKYCLAHLYTLCLSSRESQPFFLVPSNHSHATHVSIIKTSLYRQWSSTRGLNFPGKMFQNPREAGKDT